MLEASVPADGGVAGIVDLDLEADVRQLEDEEVIEHYLVLQGEVLPTPPQYDMLVEILDLNPPVAGHERLTTRGSLMYIEVFITGRKALGMTNIT